MRGGAWRYGTLVALFGVACGIACGEAGHSETERTAYSDLAPGIVASIAGRTIRIEAVRQVAEQQNLSPKQALEGLIQDGVLATAAEEQLPGSRKSAERAVLARVLLRELEQKSRAEGPPSPEEIDAVTAKHWMEVDRPESVRTVHAVVLVQDQAKRAEAKALAEKLQKAVQGLSEPEAFMKAAQAVDPGKFEVRVERLPPTAPDGRVVRAEVPAALRPKGERFDVTFARAANAIEHVGEQSGVVETSFGYHVILLTERLPAQKVPVEQRMSELVEEVITERARKRSDRLLERLRSRVSIEVSRQFEALTSKAVEN